ncbi:MAG: hypothetical protein ABI977_33505, partial [Acidobacteriota bacterium]
VIYQRALAIEEELGDRTGVASSLGQIAQLLIETEQYTEAFPLLLNALATFLKLQSPYTETTVTALRSLRAKWGAANFDAAWQKATNENVPKWVTDELEAAAS